MPWKYLLTTIPDQRLSLLTVDFNVPLWSVFRKRYLYAITNEMASFAVQYSWSPLQTFS